MSPKSKQRPRLSQDGACRDERATQVAREKAALDQRMRDRATRDERLAMVNDAPKALADAPALKPVFISPKEFVLLTGISYATLFRHIRHGKIKSTMLGARRLISYSEIERLAVVFKLPGLPAAE
jgi:excisionase family DNA binding protein